MKLFFNPHSSTFDAKLAKIIDIQSRRKEIKEELVKIDITTIENKLLSLENEKLIKNNECSIAKNEYDTIKNYVFHKEK